MKGEWLLIRLKPRPGEKRENWLLRKLEDELCRARRSAGRARADQRADRPLDGGDRRRQEGRALAQGQEGQGLRRRNGSGGRAITRRRPRRAPKRASASRPSSAPPQLATLVDAVPAGNRLDARDQVRRIPRADRRGGRARSTSTPAPGSDWTDKFAPLVEAIADARPARRA